MTLKIHHWGQHQYKEYKVLLCCAQIFVRHSPVFHVLQADTTMTEQTSLRLRRIIICYFDFQRS